LIRKLIDNHYICFELDTGYDQLNSSDQVNSEKKLYVLGAFERTANRNLFLCQIENKTAEAIYNSLKDVINPNSVLISDKYPAYHSVSSALNCDHLSD